MLQQNIILYVAKQGFQPTVKTVQADTGREIVCKIADFDIPQETAATFYALKPSGKWVQNTASVSNQEITIKLTNQVLAEKGTIACQLQLEHSGETIKTFEFTLDNKASYAGDWPVSENQSNVLDKLLQDTQEKVNQAIQEIPKEVEKYIEENPEIPSGGTTGQALVKKSNADRDMEWKTIEGGSGTPGKDGITPTIGENGNWYLGDEDTGKPSRGEKGEQGNTGAQGPTGAKGDPGEQGPVGPTPNIKIGEVTTLEPGQQATASMGGTPENPLLNLGIPKGQPGSSGQTSTPVVDHGTSDTTFALTANTYHKWGEVVSLDLTLAEGEEGVANIYWFSFTSGSTETRLTLPESIQTDLIVQPSTYYEISIVDNHMVYADWSVSV